MSPKRQPPDSGNDDGKAEAGEPSMTSGSEGDDDDLQAFAEAMRGVTRHRPRRQPGPLSALDPRPRQTLADEAAALEESRSAEVDDILVAAGDILDFRSPGLPESIYRRLCRGRFHIRDELDLHGLNRQQAKAAVAAFLNDCRASDRRCVRIVHGKGLRSGESGPVLKQHLDGWLRRRRDILAFHSARPEHGGAGAVYVLLRRAGD